MNKIVVEEDHFLKILSVILDPATPEAHKAAVQRFFAHDVADFLGWCAAFRERLPNVFPCTVDYAADQDELRAKIADARAVVTESIKIDESLLSAAPNLRLTQKFGVILSNIDEAACARHGVAIERLRRVGNIAVAEQAFALIMALSKRICELDHIVDEASLAAKGFKPRPRSPYIGYSNPAGIPGLGTLFNSKLGVVGFGEVGREIAQFAHAFGMRVGYFQRTRLSAQDEARLSARYEDLNTLVSDADFIVAQLPLNDSTRGIINADVFKHVKKGAYLVNVARAELVERDALIAALRGGVLRGLGLDVGYAEPAQLDDPLFEFDAGNVIWMPHTAIGARQNALRDMETLCMNLQKHFSS